MKLSAKFPDQLQPGQTWCVSESDLTDALTTGAVCTAASMSGCEADFVVAGARRERHERCYELVRLGYWVDLQDARSSLRTLAEHVARSGSTITLTIDGDDIATLSHPLRGKAAVEAVMARMRELFEGDAGPTATQGRG
jgi:hypothetical protein